MSQRYLGGVITANPTTPTLASLSGVWTLEQQFQNFNVWSPEIVGNSVRLRSSASAYLNRTPASAGNRTTWTWSGWVKRGALATAYITGAQANGNAGTSRFNIYFNSDLLNVEEVTINTAVQISVATTQVFRDPSAWYHIVVAMDTTQATASNRIKIYVNGSQVTAFSSTTYPTQNFTTAYNNNVANYHGYSNNLGTIGYADHYLAEINFIDGQALTPSSFGALDSTGVWQPLPYTGTYGTNGFYLTFSDNSAATAAALGKDTSGNGNNWTPNNISLTAGTTYDWMLDSPTNWIGAAGGNGVGNYAVLSPIDQSGATPSSGNLDVTVSSGTSNLVAGTIAITSGKWYWEVTIGSTTLANWMVGVADASGSLASRAWTGANGWYYYRNGDKYNNNTGSAYGASFTTGDMIGVALDMDAGTLTFYKNNSSQGTAYSSLSGKTMQAALGNGTVGGTQSYNINFGQRPFAYTPPTGFKALNTLNLSTPTILKGNQWMDVNLWTGNGTSQTITNSGSMQPDFVWIKSRSIAGYYHVLTDSVRGTNSQLFSNDTLAQETRTDRLTSFNSSGFSLGSKNDVNDNGATFVGWQWKAGGTAVTNTSGSITSTVSANTTAGFSVVTWTGNGSASQTVGHGLGVAPNMVIEKRRNAVQNWYVYFPQIGSGGTFFEGLNTTSAGSTNSTSQISFSSTTGTINNQADHNANGGTYVWYCFSRITGYSAFGSYTGNGSTDGPFVYLGFRPRYVMFKRTDSAGNWAIQDTSRSPYNQIGDYLLANASDAEVGGSVLAIDALSNGFKVRVTQANENASGGTYIYAAFAENPFNISRAR